MAFETFADFIAMGKHGPFVWSAYGIAALVLVANLVLIRQRKKHVIQTIQRKLKREQLEHEPR